MTTPVSQRQLPRHSASKLQRKASAGRLAVPLACSILWACTSGGQAADESPALAPDASSGPIALASLCGHAGEPCCAPPLRACGSAQTCNVSTALCEATLDETATGVIRLCQSPGDCLAGEICCSTGYLGACRALEIGTECPQPDLEVDFNPVVPIRAESIQVAPLDCRRECVSSPGRHRVLYFSARVINRGDTDVLFGAPGAPGVRVVAGENVGSPALIQSCGEYTYVDGLVRSELIAADGSTFATADAQFSPNCLSLSPSSTNYDCRFLGLPIGIYYADFGCEGLQVDGVPAGEYVLRTTVDPENLIIEADETNNSVETVINLSRIDPVSPCAAGEFGEDRDCGWTTPLTAICRPGSVVSVSCAECVNDRALGCAECNNDPVLRVCATTEPCMGVDALVSADDTDVDGRLSSCPTATFACPEGGSYTSFVGDYGGSVDEGAFDCAVTALRPTP